MMNSPNGYKNENENKTLEQLVLERTKLLNEIVEYEQKHIIKNEPYSADEIAKPSAKDIYNMHNLYLKEITDLIIEGNGFKNTEVKHIEELKKLEKRLYSKDCFFLEIRSGAVLPIEHPHYYDNRLNVLIDEQFNNLNSTINIQKEDYKINREQLSKIKSLIKDKFDILIELAKKQTTEIYDGTYNRISVKINSVFLNLSLDNVTSEDDYNILTDLKKNILGIIIPKDEKDLDKVINELVNKIIALPKGTEISIGQLLENEYVHYNTNELFEINKRVLSICKEKGIKFNFDKYKDKVVGLPFNIPFIIE